MLEKIKDFKIEKFDTFKHSRLIEELTKILHSAYRPLAEQGMKYLATHQSPEITLSRLKSGESFLGFLSDELISTITLVEAREGESCEYYRKPGVYFFTQFAVKPDCQKLGIGSYLMDFIEDHAKFSGAKYLALDTSERAIDLINLYSKRNYKLVDYVQWDVTNYRSVVLSKEL